MIKRIVCFLLSVLLLFSFVACSNSETTEDNRDDSSVNETEKNIVTDDNKESHHEQETIDITADTESHNVVTEQSTVEDETSAHLETKVNTYYVETEKSEPVASDKIDDIIVESNTSSSKPPQNIDCSHKYNLTDTIASTCTKSGMKTYTCSKCGHSYKEPMPMVDHNYTAATCTTPKTCKICSKTAGKALGHSFGADNKCSRCDVKNSVDESKIELTVSVKNDKGISVKDVAVTIYEQSSSKLVADGKTNKSGVFTVIADKDVRYRVILSDLPTGYTAEESYIAYNTTRVNIRLKSIVMVNPDDHSNANYSVGSIMWDFTVVDTDGNTYNLSQLLKDKELIILDFGYVACGPCKSEFPYFEAAHKKYGDDVTILAMNHFDSETDIKELREELGVTFPMVKENLGFLDAFDLSNYPTTVIINSNGKIISIHREPYDSEEDFLGIIESLLK